jgi:DNA polymerase-1
VELHLVDSVEEAMKFKRWLGERRPYDIVGLDLETGETPGHPKSDALSPWLGHIRLIQIGDSEQGWAIPWEYWSGVFYEAMKNYTGKIVCHNIAFEALWMAVLTKWEMPWHNAHDTMLMSQVINPAEASHGLKNLSSKYIDAQASALQASLQKSFDDNGWTWGTVPVDFDPYWMYGALDPVITVRLWIQYWETCAPGQIYNTPYEIEMAARRICTQMELRGARVDLDYSQRKMDELDRDSQAIRAWGKQKYGISLGSSAQLAPLFTKLGVNIVDRTPTGLPQMGKEQFEYFSITGSPEAKHLAEQVLKMKKFEKLSSTYFSNFLTGNMDGILHPNINLMGAKTGRMSINNPALQTLPSKDPTVRRAFIPREDGYGIVASDLDQVEFRLTASYANDLPLIALFNDADATGGDVFTNIMREVYQDSALSKSDPRRGLIKGVVYGKLYGAGVDKMALTAKVEVSQMRPVVDAFDANYPAVKKLQRAIEDVGTRRLRSEGEGYVITHTGRRLPADGTHIYRLTNYLIQASAAEVFKKNLIKLDAAGMTDYMIVPVHDEIVMEVPTHNRVETTEIMTIIQECMTTLDEWALPLTAGVEGPFANWGIKYESKS